jgi:general nucleoside transport system permease protein
VLSVLAAMVAGAVWAGIAGFLRATTGANEVITTIMLNWIAVWAGVYLFAIGGPLQNEAQRDLPVSEDIASNTHLPVFWGDPELQGLHIGIFIAVLAAVLFWVLMRRSARGYEARAVGLNPEAARYGGIHVGRTYVWVMALCGLLAGLAGSLDILGLQFRIATNDIQVSQIGYLGIAVALLGRNTAAGTCIGALLFGALLQGTSVRNLDPSIFRPELAENLTRIIQGLIVLFVAADFLIAWLIQRARGRRVPVPDAPAGGAG